MTNHATVVAPLTNLLKRHRQFVWDADCKQAFQPCKDRLTSARPACPDYSLSFNIQTDASDGGLGTVLSQTHLEGKG